jgi:acyl carrier protein
VKKRGSDKVLVAYVVSNNGVELDLDALRAHLRERLPAFMAPAVLIPLESIPLTPNGKADRASLPDPNSRDHQAAAAEYLAPRNEVEARAARLFEGVLGVKSPSVNANFFELGGHSLMATQLVSRIREEFTVEISLRDFFHTPTIEALASAIAAGKANGFGSAINRQSLSLEEQLDALDCAASGVRAS